MVDGGPGHGLTGAAAGPFLGAGLRYFRAAAQPGSIAEASAELHRATSAISRHSTRLEHEIGGPLFERRPRGMVLSDPQAPPASIPRGSVLETDHSGALSTFAKLAAAVPLPGRLPVRRRLAADGLVAVPRTDRGMHQRDVQIRSTAGRELPPAVQEFVAHLVGRRPA